MIDFNIVKKSIDEWDPYGLFPEAPNDEYDEESRVIANSINSSMNSNEIAEIISIVFSESFGEELTINDCLNIAELIYEYISNDLL